MLQEVQIAADAAVELKRIESKCAEDIKQSFAQQLTAYTYLSR